MMIHSKELDCTEIVPNKSMCADVCRRYLMKKNITTLRSIILHVIRALMMQVTTSRSSLEMRARAIAAALITWNVSCSFDLSASSRPLSFGMGILQTNSAFPHPEQRSNCLSKEAWYGYSSWYSYSIA